VSNPQQPYGGGWPGDPNQPPTDPNQQYNLTPPGGASYDVGSPQGFEQAGYGQPDYSGQFNQAEYDQQYSGAGYEQQYSAPGYGQPQYGAPGYGPNPGYPPQPGFGPGGPGGPPPKKTSWLPWVLGGGGVLALVLVILLVVVLVSNSGGGGGGNNNAQASSGPTAKASSSSQASAPPAGGTYKVVDNLCDVLDTSSLSSIADQKYGTPSNSKSSYGDYTYITCDTELTNNGTSDLNLVTLDASADIYSDSSDASSYFDTEYDSAKSDTSYKFKDISDLGQKAFSSYTVETSGSYKSIIQEVKVLDGNAEFDIELIMTTSTSVSRDQSEEYAKDIAKALMSSLHN
jgi:hypothetical protein